ncbi:response regulator transcription factor [Nitrospirillum amazonense]|uniref:Winged helix family two component transcriptional regulator n=1 Tax=Nitrospirillum amazonense TaxID=28077 RepID=A0A560JHL7_9PROT|nr:response regulator transcription factor [Nitrospirillum amazonense]MDG3439644.1 response regulator transcription factor [Nitrospirillum amazonense]TWB70688.1 winged helix family two component transcriptional regulator [Nitrospirillum amazonense]
MDRILLVDDDVALVDMLREYLEQDGFAVDAAHDGAACFDHAPEELDLIVLDVMLPKLSGFDVLKRLRQRSDVPVIMLTARDDDVDRIVGFEIGADDYVPKPVNPRELVSRIRAVLRRVNGGANKAPADLQVGSVRLNPTARVAWNGEWRLDLTSAEFSLLEHLLRGAGRIISRDELSAAAFGRHHAAGADRNVDTLVSKVRRKLDATIIDGEQPIKTIRNVGYLYALPPS